MNNISIKNIESMQCFVKVNMIKIRLNEKGNVFLNNTVLRRSTEGSSFFCWVVTNCRRLAVKILFVCRQSSGKAVKMHFNIFLLYLNWM